MLTLSDGWSFLYYRAIWYHLADRLIMESGILLICFVVQPRSRSRPNFGGLVFNKKVLMTHFSNYDSRLTKF